MTDDKLKKDLTDIFAKTFGKVPKPAEKALEDLSLRRPPAGGASAMESAGAGGENQGDEAGAGRRRRKRRRRRGEAPQCKIEGCARPVLARNLCSAHYRRELYREKRESAGLPYRPRAGRVRTVADLRKARRTPLIPIQRTGGSTPRLILEILRDCDEPMPIDRVCELVAERMGAPDPILARRLRGRVRHFLYTSPKVDRVSRGTFKINSKYIEPED